MWRKMLCLLITAAVLLALLPAFGMECTAAATTASNGADSVPEADTLLYILVGVDIFLMTVAVILIGILANSLRKKRK